MKKIVLAFATISALAFTLPSIASAKTVIIKHGHHHMDRGWHHGHGKKVVVIRHGRHHY